MSSAGAAAGGYVPKPFAVRSETAEAASIVSAEGEVDLNTAPQLEEALLAAENEEEQEVIVDLREVDFIDSSGLRALILSGERLNKREKELHVVCTAGAVRRVFDAAAITERFAISESREDALAGLRPG